MDDEQFTERLLHRLCHSSQLRDGFAFLTKKHNRPFRRFHEFGGKLLGGPRLVGDGTPTPGIHIQRGVSDKAQS